MLAAGFQRNMTCSNKTWKTSRSSKA